MNEAPVNYNLIIYHERLRALRDAMTRCDYSNGLRHLICLWAHYAGLQPQERLSIIVAHNDEVMRYENKLATLLK